MFGYTDERKMERALIGEYRRTVEDLLPKLDAGQPGRRPWRSPASRKTIRGYGHVKERNLVAAKRKEAELIAAFDAGPTASRAA